MKRKTHPNPTGRILARVHAEELSSIATGSGQWVDTPPSTGQGFNDKLWVQDPTAALQDN